jgi:hypothetical protein
LANLSFDGLHSQIGETFDISYLKVGFDGNEDKIEFDNEMWKMIKTLFRAEKGKPATLNDVKKLYLSMLKNVTVVKFVIATKIRSRDKDRGKYIYSVDDEVIQSNVHLMLKRYRVEDTDALQKFHKGALKYLPKFDKAHYFGHLIK